jgi:hypothetical protein
MHGGMKIGAYWSHIRNYEWQQFCRTCYSTESMEHILINCGEGTTSQIWNLAKETWPHSPLLWPEINLGTVLGCGTLIIPRTNEHQAGNYVQRNQRSQTRLLQILISEAAHLIWVLRCERVLQDCQHTRAERESRWKQAINTRLTDDQITATKIKCEKSFTFLVKTTWEQLLKNKDAPTLNRAM